MKNLLPAFPLSSKDYRDSKPLNENFNFVDSEKMAHCIHYLKTINCFIGVNNSGKSRLIRALFSGISQNATTNNIKIVISIKKEEFPILSFLDNENKNGNIIDFLHCAYILLLIDEQFYVFENYEKVYEYWNAIERLISDKTTLQKITDFIKNNKLFLLSIVDFSKKQQNIDDLVNAITTQNDNKNKANLNLESLQNKQEELTIIMEELSKHNEHNKLLKQIEAIQQIPLNKTNLNKLQQQKSTLELQPNKNHPQIQQQIQQIKTKIKNIQQQIESLESLNAENLQKEINSLRLSEIREEASLRKLLKQFNSDQNEKKIKLYQSQITEIDNSLHSFNEKLQRTQQELNDAILRRVINEISALREIGITSLNNTVLQIPKLYIPILRNTRPFDDSKTDFYASRTLKDYKIDKTFTGLSMYKELQMHLLGNHQKRQMVKEYEKFLSESFFDENEVTLIPHIDSDVIYIRIGEKEHPIYELGDGVQALITLTFPVFLRKNENWAIFIEEPELHLHPKWQFFFMKTIKKYFYNHQFFLTTHSNIFLLDKNASIYHVFQGEKTHIKYVNNQHSEILSELGYKPSDVLNANCIIWVEGFSDKIYLTQFIKAYDSELQEGEHYSVMFYGGCTNLVNHISLTDSFCDDKVNILNINPNCAFVLDSDLEAGETIEVNQKEKYLFKQNCEEKGKICWITTTRELENLIPIEVWKRAAISYAKKLPNNETYVVSLDDVQLIPDTAGTREFNNEFDDRTHKKKGTLVVLNASSNITVRINDKIKMAREVTSLFPINKENLLKVPELFSNIEKLVTLIKNSNK